METIVAMILAAVTIGFVGFPLLKANPEEEVEQIVEEESGEDELALQKEATFGAIAELDFDHAMGNLSDQDHDELRERYKLKAMALMKQLDEAEKASAKIRPRAQETSAREGGVTRAFCPGCGARLASSDRFCSSCGESLTSGCPKCGSPRSPDDAFCANCGQKL